MKHLEQFRREIDGTVFELELEPFSKKRKRTEETAFLGSVCGMSNPFIQLKSSSAIFEIDDVIRLMDNLELLVSGKLTEEVFVGFTEPDLECYLKPNSSGFSLEVRLYPYLDGFSSQYYCLEFDEDDTVPFLTFLKKCQLEGLNE